ncbi:hypothetical protein, variant [Verruconis gallopava]|uniref:Mediator of RNA polymerase II transcription subunit 17 n=1 Tax=Verruconis gallopava TaxID=253628 RepID=A0A0D1Y0C9_9PEZI|nr:hypothetical protein, variant [Verruconis gallopava]KIW08491.1 hypothetical protein, variant [Verruconis gallopava]
MSRTRRRKARSSSSFRRERRCIAHCSTFSLVATRSCVVKHEFLTRLCFFFVLNSQSRENSLWALDTFSLTASSILKQSFQTASPAMRESIKEGSFSYTRRQAQPSTNPERERQKNQLWAGSFMTNNTESADTLLAAATRLEGLVKAETEYWRQLLSLTSKGWPVYKPGPHAPMHVRFVASEASPDFKSQGVAQLVPDEEGTIQLGSSVGREPRTLRLRRSRRGEVVASSVTASLLSLADLGSSLEDRVRREQSSLFEEELFQELAMESRILRPLGVKLRDKVLHLPVTSAQGEAEEYLVDLISIDEASEAVAASAPSEEKDVLDAQSVLLRLLLCHVYQLRLQRRSQIPPPLSDAPRKAPPSSILRTFLALNQHYAVCVPLEGYLAHLQKLLTVAGLPFSRDAIRLPGLHELLENTAEVLDEKKKREQAGHESLLHSLLEQISQPQRTTARLRLAGLARAGASTEHVVSIHVRTDLSAPIYGSEFVLELPAAMARLMYGRESHDKTVRFADLAEVRSFVNQLMSLHIVFHELVPRAGKGWVGNADTAIISKAVDGKDQQSKLAVGVRVENEQVEMRRRWFGGRADQDREVWSLTSTRAKSLPAVFEAWARQS